MIFNDNFKYILDNTIPKEFLEEADKEMAEAHNYGIQTKYITALKLFAEAYEEMKEDCRQLDVKFDLAQLQNSELLDKVSECEIFLNDIKEKASKLKNSIHPM